MVAPPETRPIPYHSWLLALAVVLTGMTFALIVIGGGVTSHEAGMAVPDWPGTFGYNMFLAPLDKWFRDPETGNLFRGPLWEHSHRLMGSLVGLVMIVTAACLWFTQRSVGGGGGGGRAWVRWLGIVLLTMIVLQGLMGGFRVTENSRVLAMLHGVFGQVILCAIVLLTMTVSRRWQLLGAKRQAAESDVAPLWERSLGAVLVVAGVTALLAWWRGSRNDEGEGLIIWSLGEVGWVCFGGVAIVLAISLTRLVQELAPAAATQRVAPPAPPQHRPPLLRTAAFALLAVLGVQLVLGAAVRHFGAATAIPDAPLVYGRLTPPPTPAALDAAIDRLPPSLAPPLPGVTLAHVWLQYTHRLMAVLFLLLLGGAVVLMIRSHVDPAAIAAPFLLVLVLTGAQIMLGVMTIWSEVYPTVATLHQATGAALLAAATWWAIRVHLASPTPTPAGEDLPRAAVRESDGEPLRGGLPA